MEFNILGPLEVVRDGEPLDLGGAKQRTVLAVLLNGASRVVSCDALADAVWDGDPPPSAATTLRGYISNLRRVLEVQTTPQTLRTSGAGYLLDTSAHTVDALRFADLVSSGDEAMSRGDHAGAARIIAEALASWRGSAYEDFADLSFGRAEIARLEELRLHAVEQLMECRLAHGQHAEVTGELEGLTAIHPLRERLWHARILALYRCGRQGDALKAYEQARSTLSEELGIDPSPELRRLHESIVRQDESLEQTRPAQRRDREIATFLFTDVERSTRIQQSLGERYDSVLDDQRDLMREVCERHGATRIQSTGEEFLVVFVSPADAIRAAVDAQLALRSYDWPVDGELRVRVGIHTGEARVTPTEHSGLSLHLAARVCDAAHGGQIVVSGATAGLIEPTALEPVQLADLGQHRLKDFDDPVRLYQVEHRDLPATFSPPRTLSSSPHNLPTPLTSFVGRHQEVAAVCSDLDVHRLVTLTGVGGVGKTRLATEAGGEVLPRYPDGVWLCELAPVTDEDGLVQAIQHAVGLQRQRGLSLRESVIASLRTFKTLLVLDNCEHLLGPVAELAEDVLLSCPDVRLLATSREGIGIDGEHIRPVRSLTVPATSPEGETGTDASDSEAIRLFVDRAQAVRPDFTLGPHNATAVVDICRRLDGIPLAIELAAARVPSMGPLEIAARLDQRFRFLRSGRRTAVERHRTLQAAVDWSFALLSPHEQVLFERLSVFAGGFTLDAAEDVVGAGLDVDVTDVLQALVQKSILIADVTGDCTRYSMLETMRQYGLEKLVARGEAERLRDTHARHFLALALRASEGLSTADERTWTSALYQEWDNLGTAHSWAVTSDDIDLAAGLISALRWFGGFLMVSEVDTWTERTLSMPGAKDHPLYARILGIAAEGAWYQGDLPRAHELGERALVAAPDPDDARRIEALDALAATCIFEGRWDDGLAFADDVVRLARSHGDRRVESQWLHNQALIKGYAGDVEGGLEKIAEGRKVLTAAPSWQAYSKYVTGEVILDSDPERALAYHEEAIELAAGTYAFIAGIAGVSAASLHGRYFDADEALRRYIGLIDGWRRTGNWLQQWTTLRNVVETFSRIGLDAAAVTLTAAAEVASTAPPLIGAYKERLERFLPELEEQLGRDGFDAASKLGAQMGPTDAIAFARAEIRSALDERARSGASA